MSNHVVSGWTLFVLCLHRAYANYTEEFVDTDGNKCLTAWSPCTVTCLDESNGGIFAKKWRMNRCSGEHVFKECNKTRLPLCLTVENNEHYQREQTQHRVIAYFFVILMCALILTVPSILIWLSYTKDFFCTSWSKADLTSSVSIRADDSV
ncbi:hypothetical protein L596_022499 [Steinernema carpocapsae]|uniref:Uncharacterized protein n=1 Tax=Steinernema carpocapsae TaxID=34508 RepID=A0A4U5MMA1_STECR|nr:hypothetical protein L596_022499 [Steinernema carpocapsae]